MLMSVRIARAATGKSGVAFCGYHGWHDWYLAANLGESTALDGHLIPGLEPRGVPRELAGTSVPFRYNDLASLDQALAQLGGNLAAVVMEPMRSQQPTDDFVAKVAAKCRAAGAVFVVDEVTSGLRYGYPGAMAELGIAPDIVVYAKAMSNGIPFGAVVGRTAVMEAAESSFISSSYWTDGIGPAAVLAVLEKMERLKVYDQIRAKGAKLQESMRVLAKRYPACRLKVGGMPSTPSVTFDLGDDTSLAQTIYVRRMRERGILAFATYYLMLAHEDQHIAELLAGAEAAFAEIESLINSGKLAETAGVPRGRRGFARLA
jgi:glutamate-1-semialdehyde 2,1-aminomutase